MSTTRILANPSSLLLNSRSPSSLKMTNSEPRVRKSVPLGGSVVDHPDNNPRAWFCHMYGRLRFSGINEDVVRKVERRLESYIKENPKPARLVVTFNHVEVSEERLFEEIKDKPANGPDIAMLKRSSIKDMELKDDEICLVCLQKLADYEEADVKITCMPCNHVFHDNCITTWLMNRRFCPLCRFELGQKSDEAKE